MFFTDLAKVFNYWQGKAFQQAKLELQSSLDALAKRGRQRGRKTVEENEDDGGDKEIGGRTNAMQ